MDDELPSPFEVAISLAKLFGEKTLDEIKYCDPVCRQAAREQRKQVAALIKAVELLSEEVERLRIDRAT